jgi:hypothetical protein
MLGVATGSGSQPPAPVPDFGDYDFRMFDDVSEMRAEIVSRDGEVGLSRLVAGYAWEWKTKGNKPSHDIEIGELRMRWNSTQTDWIASPGSLDEVGSIHTVQGYDLNYAGKVIGPNLRCDTTTCPGIAGCGCRSGELPTGSKVVDDTLRAMTVHDHEPKARSWQDALTQFLRRPDGSHSDPAALHPQRVQLNQGKRIAVEVERRRALRD